MANPGGGITIFTRPARLVCEKWGESPEITFEGHPRRYDASVKIKVGDFEALISRDELASASALFPPLPPVKS
jgi:hypothetical protein